MRAFWRAFFFLGLPLAAACSQEPESGSPPSEPPPEDLARGVAEVFSDFAVPGSPGAAVSVIRDGEVLLAEGFGLAQVEEGRPLDRTTPMRLGSVGKQFTSMAIMILAERGDLTLDDPVTRWVPELGRFPGVTVRHLLTHTSGLPDYYDLPDEALAATAGSDDDPLLTNEDVVTIYESWGEPSFAPGERYEYSNPAYDVLALIVERLSGLSFGGFLAENVFGPLGMRSAAVRDRPETVIPGRAVGYRPGESEGTWTENDDHMANWLVGAGGVYATLDDLFLWDQALYTEDLVSRSALDLAFSPTTLNDGSVSEYGFGWNLSDVMGRSAVHHGGSWVGFRANIIRFVDDATTVIVLSNASASAGDLAREVAELVLGGEEGL